MTGKSHDALHELRVHQVELELQNEELIAARATIEAAQRKYFRYFDLAPVGMVRLSSDAIILETNILGARMLGLNRDAFVSLPRRMLLNVMPEWHLEFQRHLESAFASGKMETCELLLRDADGIGTFVRIQSVRSPGDSAGPDLYMTLTDLTERRNIEQLLARQKAELSQEIAERSRLENEVLAISEREQCRLGMDLHDGLGQQLAGITLLCKVLADKLAAEDHPCASAAQEIANYNAETINTARNLAKGLYPLDLARDGLLVALEMLADHVHQQFRINCTLRRLGPEPQCEKAAEIHLYRMVQECISNAIKHGRAQSIIIESDIENGIHTLSVIDDGLGFGPAHSPGMGLRSMQYRARLINAVVTLERPEAGGCKVSCRLLDPGHTQV